VARLIVCRELTAVPWKNGGGSTSELAAFPPGAGFDHFDWRISVATINESGAFSAFPGIDRSLVLVDGAALLLDVGGAAVRLDAAQARLSFTGETPVFATVSGLTKDFNVMTRRGRCRHEVARLAMTPSPLVWHRRGAVSLLFLADGECAEVAASGGEDRARAWTLGRHDALLFGAEDAGMFSVNADAGSIVLVVELFTD